MTWENEPDPTPLELITLEFAARYERAAMALGIKSGSLLLLRQLVVDGQFSTVSALARSSGVSRSTVRAALEQLVRQGMAATNRGRYGATAVGQGFLMRVHRETIDICFGRRDGFSQELISFARDDPSSRPTSAASKITFDRP